MLRFAQQTGRLYGRAAGAHQEQALRHGLRRAPHVATATSVSERCVAEWPRQQAGRQTFPAASLPRRRYFHVQKEEPPRQRENAEGDSGTAASSSTSGSGQEAADGEKQAGKAAEAEGLRGFLRSLDKDLLRNVSILTGSQLVLNLGFSQMVPVIPMLAAQMGSHLGATGIGLVISAPSIAMLLFNVPAGRLSDTIGRKPLMYGGTLICALGTFGSAFAGSITTLIPCRFLVGAGICASTAGSQAFMVDLSDKAPNARARIMGLSSMVAGSVWVVGPAIGGWLAETYGYRNSFLLASASSVLCCLGYLWLPETLPSKPGAEGAKGPAAAAAGGRFASVVKHVSDWWRDIRPVLRSGPQQGLIAMSLVPALRFGCFTTVVALQASQIIGAGAKEIGWMYAFLAASQGVSTPIGSYAADKYFSGSRLALVLPAGLLSCASFAGLAFSTDLEHYLMAMALQGFCAGFTVSAQGAFRAEVTPQAVRGQALSLERFAGSIIGLIAPVGLGFLADMTSCPSVILLTSGLMAACHAVYFARAGKPPPVA
mmetsp:Transcript_2204/g.3755  ORF Transcript_2204/g.3755 Transcript_2204/m.3755 type:complete len:542 (-) Transcript_2204:116-1741(-)